jgi:predicted CXXCH cytochrome family protein
MVKHFLDQKLPVLILVITGALLLGLLWVFPVRAESPAQETENYCLGCHSNPEIGNISLPNGDLVALFIDPQILATSIHSPLGIECEACHTSITTYPHPEITYQSARELSRSYYLACQKCHSDNYDRSLDSMHAQVAGQGNLAAPICTDCHGAHDVQVPDEPRTRISATCGDCHQEIYTEYTQSVHGSALVEGNLEVPVCTDCHGVHNIQDPRTAQFRINEPELCAGCHANKALMDRYGLSSDVYDVYQISWHGVDLSVYKARWPTIWHNSAICSDCHGVHNILSTDNSASSVSPENLQTTCQKCHPNVGPNWTGAWTGHYRISLSRTPFVYYTDAFYFSLTPLILWISGIYVLLQLVRTTVERARRSLNEPHK